MPIGLQVTIRAPVRHEGGHGMADASAVDLFTCLTVAASSGSVPSDTLVIRRWWPPEPTETVFGSLATEPWPKATLPAAP